MQEPFINQSATKIDKDFSLHRTYLLFRTLGLRHLMVTDSRNRCVGMITRKDLLAFQIAERLIEKDGEDEVFEVSLESTRRGSDTVLPAITVLTPVGEEEEHQQHPAETQKAQNNNNNSSLLKSDIVPSSTPRGSSTKL